MIKTVIIDDELFCVEVLESLLKMHYPDVQILGSFTDPEKAISFIRSNPPQLVPLHINMSSFKLLDNLYPLAFKFVVTTT